MAEKVDEYSLWRQYISNTDEYKAWRTSVFERDDYTCQMCKVRGGKLEAHHIHPVRDYRGKECLFSILNGITLCKKCHSGINKHEEDYEKGFSKIAKDNIGENWCVTWRSW